jgi:hypothetical protein
VGHVTPHPGLPTVISTYDSSSVLLVDKDAGLYIVSSTLLVWSANTHLTAANYTLVLQSRLNFVLHAKLHHHHNLGVIISVLQKILSLRIKRQLGRPS